MDIEIGALRSFILTHQWPFETAKLELDEYEPRHSETTARFARKYLLDKVPWDEVHYELAEQYTSEKEYQAAFSELRAVNWTYHENVLPFLMIGDLFKSQGRREEAHWYYQKAAEKSQYRRRGHSSDPPLTRGEESKRSEVSLCRRMRISS